VNGPLLEELAHSINFKNAHCVDFFRQGKGDKLCACLIVAFIRAGAPLFDDGADRLLGHCEASNSELLSSLREDTNGTQLHQIALDDAAKHRMTAPERARDFDTRQVPC
jgi:hypothetical protein